MSLLFGRATKFGCVHGCGVHLSSTGDNGCNLQREGGLSPSEDLDNGFVDAIHGMKEAFFRVQASGWAETFNTMPEADNCVRENKNNTLLKFLPWILLQKGLEFSGLVFQRVGHTHGSLGSLAFKLKAYCYLLYMMVFSGTHLRPNLRGPQPVYAVHRCIS